MLLYVALPLVLLVTATAYLDLTGLDLAITRHFYDSHYAYFPCHRGMPWVAIYYLGESPGTLLGVGGLLVGLASSFLPNWKVAGRCGLLLGAIMLIGPGMLVNGVIKEVWGRPRPHQTVYFGGDYAFRPVWSPIHDSETKSFPSGHAAMGFYLAAPAVFLWNRRQRLALGFVALGVTSGCFVGFCRVAQGRHFVTDILWSAAVVYFTCLVFYLLFGRKSTEPTSQPSATEAVLLPFEPAGAQSLKQETPNARAA